MAVYYALPYANNSLAIIPYKQSRGVPFQELQEDPRDSMMCARESKFALIKGPATSWRFLQRLGAYRGIAEQLPPKPAKVTVKPDSDKSDREGPGALQVKCHLLGRLVSCGAGNTGLT